MITERVGEFARLAHQQAERPDEKLLVAMGRLMADATDEERDTMLRLLGASKVTRL